MKKLLVLIVLCLSISFLWAEPGAFPMGSGQWLHQCWISFSRTRTGIGQRDDFTNAVTYMDYVKKVISEKNLPVTVTRACFAVGVYFDTVNPEEWQKTAPQLISESLK